jgi:S-adenosyl-L-methionine hydrolase (adenosine-forming)
VKIGRGGGSKTGRKGSRSPGLPVITLLTDFGTADYFVGAMKGAILSVNPAVTIVDISHEIPPQDIEAGAFTLLAGYDTFPAGTIHVAVVDPGVGSTRRPIIVSAGKQLFVGPDNGLFTYICDRESSDSVYHITAEKYFRPSPSATFHGRDIFAPVAAALSTGVAPPRFGPLIKDEVRLEAGDQTRIIHIDHFGNCVTNITRPDLKTKKVRLVVNGKTIRDFRTFYGESQSKSPFAIWGSAGFLEISVNGGSAAKILRAARGDSVIVRRD